MKIERKGQLKRISIWGLRPVAINYFRVNSNVQESCGSSIWLFSTILSIIVDIYVEVPDGQRFLDRAREEVRIDGSRMNDVRWIGGARLIYSQKLASDYPVPGSFHPRTTRFFETLIFCAY